MAPPARYRSQPELLYDSQYTPRLRASSQLAELPAEAATPQRARASQTWQALRAGQEDMLNDRLELQRMDRALLASRKQLFAARQEARAAQEQVQQLEQHRFAPPVVWGLGLVALVSVAGWVHSRRKLLGLHDGPEPVKLQTLPTPAPQQQPPPRGKPVLRAVEPSERNAFEYSDLSVHGDEADQWIAASGVAMPATAGPERAA